MADKKQIIGVVKKNGVSILAAAVALLAAGAALMWPPGWLEKTKTEIDAREAVQKEVSTLPGRSRKLPQLSVAGTAEAEQLGMFPNKATTAAGEAAIAKLKEQAEGVVKEADAVGNHQPLVKDIFGGARIDQGKAFTFREEYGKYMPDGLNAICNGAPPPLQTEVTAAITAEKDRIQREMPIRGPGNTIINQDQVQAALTAADISVPMKMREDLASKHSVYVNRDTWTVYSGLDATSATPKEDQIWYAQVVLWIQQDVARAVAEANAGSRSIVTSPVKHVVKVNVMMMQPPGSQTQNMVPYLAVGPAGEAAVPVSGVNPAATITPNHVFSFTGHLPNAVYDVCKYEMVVRVSEDHVAEFLAQIPRGRLHYVTNVDMRTVDANVEASTNGLTYGHGPVVELAVECEALFLRKAYENWMPKTVKQVVGIEQPPAVPGAGG